MGCQPPGTERLLIKKADKLIVFEMLPMSTVDTQKIVDILNPLAEKALAWSTAISKGDTPQIMQSSTSGMFGLR